MSEERVVKLEELPLGANIIESTKSGVLKAIKEAKKKTARSNVRVDVATYPDGRRTYIGEDYSTQKRTRIDPLKYIQELGLCPKATQILVDDIQSKKITITHVRDLHKADRAYEISRLTPDQQCELAKQVPNNRMSLERHNEEEVITLALQNGEVNQSWIELWYTAVIELLEKLLSRLAAGAQFADQLDRNKKKKLNLLLDRLIPIVEGLRNRL